MTCTDFCTAAKCAELEARIDDLSSKYETLLDAHLTLKQSFEDHEQLIIPIAHEYTPIVDVVTSVYEGFLYTTVAIDNVASTSSVDISVEDLVVSFDIVKLDTVGHFDFVLKLNDFEAISTLVMDYPEVVVNLEGYYYDNSIELYLTGEGYTEDLYSEVYFELDELSVENVPPHEHPEYLDHVVSNLAVDVSFFDNSLRVTVSDGESSGTGTDIVPAKYRSSGGDGSVSCEQTITDCCEQLAALITGVSTKIDSVIIQNTEIKEEITIDITNTVNHNYECEFAVDDNDKLIPTYASSKYESTETQGAGFKGINEFLKVIATNLDTIHNDVCKAIDPIGQVLGKDLYKLCPNTESIQRTDYPEGDVGTSEYEAAIAEYVKTVFAESKYGQYVNSSDTDVLLSAPNNWIVPMLVDFALIQARDNNDVLCRDINNMTEVVSVLASPSVVNHVDDNVLILHFVTFNNYPKRARGSDHREIQIPGALDSYDWDTHFKDLTWSKGNQYGELELNEYKAKVSGWFLDKAAGETYFDRVLTLTKGTEKNRRYPDIKVKRTDIPEVIERPYRAFIEKVNSKGQAICLAKYVPPIDSN